MQFSLDTHQAGSHLSLFINNAHWSLACNYSVNMRQQKQLWHFWIWHLCSHKGKRCSQTLLKISNTDVEGKTQLFPFLQWELFQNAHEIVTTILLPTFSYSAITTVLLSPLCGIHNTETAKKPRGNLFHKKYGGLCLPLTSCKSIYKILTSAARA